MSDVISQDDIDSLLAEVEKGGSAANAAKPGPAVPLPKTDLSEWGLNEEPPPPPPQPAPQPTLTGHGPRASAPRSAESVKDIEFLLDIPLRVSVEVGRTMMSIGDLLTVGPGSIVELDKMAGEPLEIYINQKLVARGEAVIVNEKFGIRLTEVVSKAERIENLKT